MVRDADWLTGSKNQIQFLLEDTQTKGQGRVGVGEQGLGAGGGRQPIKQREAKEKNQLAQPFS